MKNIDYIKKLLEEKEKQSNPNDIEKIEELKKLLKIDNVFLKIDLETALGIFEFLGVDISEMEDLYTQLTSPQNYKSNGVYYGGKV